MRKIFHDNNDRPQPVYTKEESENIALYIFLGVIGGAFALIVIAIISVSVLSGILNTVRDHNASRETVFFSNDHSFKVMTDNSWDKGDESGISLYLRKRDNSAYFMVRTFNKKLLTSSAHLDAFEASVEDGFKEQGIEHNGDFTSIDINGYHAGQIKLKEHGYHSVTCCLETLIETDESFYQIYTATLESDYDKYEQELKDIVNSFQLIK